MDYTCKNCGNVFGDYLSACPACGTPADKPAQDTNPAASDAQQQAYQQQPYQQQPYQQQDFQQPYQQQPYQQAYQQQAYQQPYQQVYSNPNQKSKIAAGLLGIFLGWLGVHNFYLGFTGKAIAQLLISVLSCFTLSFISAIWGLIEGILILTGSQNTDANGMPLTD